MTDPYSDAAADIEHPSVPSADSEGTERSRRWYGKRGLAVAMTAVLTFVAGFLVGYAGVPGLEERLDGTQQELADIVARLDAAEQRAEEAEVRADEGEERAQEAEQALDDLADLEAQLAEQEEALALRAEELDVVEEVEEELAEAEETGAGIGASVEFNDWTLTLTEVQVHGPMGSSTPRGKFVALILDVTNNASTERELMGGFDTDFRLADLATDREYSYDSSASLEHHHTFGTDAWHLEDIGPGFTARLPIVFDVGNEVRGGMAAMVSGRNVSDFFFVNLE